MKKLGQKYYHILAVLLEKGTLSSSHIHEELVKRLGEVALVTVKRSLSEMVSDNLLVVEGVGPATVYKISAYGRICADVEARIYTSIEPDRRYGMDHYNFELFASMPDDIFFEGELKLLEQATDEYRRRTTNLPEAIRKKELERLIIELSWKSSKIEGNTYTLLDTEKLILEHKEAPGHSKDEARMILNHKDAFTFIHDHPGLFTTLTRTNLEELHAILVKDLSIGRGLRQRPVGILGSKYIPLDNGYQIEEAVAMLAEAVTRMKTVYAKALMALMGISYIQPFDDGNKRTSRLMANALLVAHGYAPLSYRSVEESEYREALLVFYELNVMNPFKTIFVAQYDFAARNYAVG